MSAGKIYPDHFDFRPYDPLRDEDFRRPYFLAVRDERTDLLRTLAGS
jgi:hypothetical protein